MKKGIIAIGVVLIILSLLGYKFGPSLVAKEISNLTGGTMGDTMTSSLLSQMGIPSVGEMIKFAKYSFIGLGIAGIGMVIFGIVSKKSKPQFAIPKIEYPYHEEHVDLNKKSNALHTLQERLARGEITSSQYINLKKLLEEDSKNIN